MWGDGGVKRLAAVCMIVFWMAGACAFAEASDIMRLGNGAAYPLFQVTPNREIYFALEENKGSLLFSRTSLYHFDLETMSADRVFSLSNQFSSIYVNDEMVCIRKPYSAINFLTPGQCAWYTFSWNAGIYPRDVSGWTFLTDQSEIRYIMAGGTLYQIRESEDGDGYCELRDASGTEIILNEKNVGYIPCHTLIVIWPDDEDERDGLRVYDVAGERVIEVPYSGMVIPEALIANQRLFYTDNSRVISYSMLDGTSKVLFESETDPALDLCMDGSSVFIIEDGEKRTLYAYDIYSDEITAAFEFPKGLGDYYLVADGLLLAGNRYTKEFSAFDLSTGERFDIALN